MPDTVSIMAVSSTNPPTPTPSRPDRGHRRERSPEAVAVWRRVGVASALAAAITGCLAAAVWFDVAATRPPCPPGYVRFIDLGPLMGWVCLGLAVVGLLTAVLARALRGSRVVAVLAGVLVVVVVLLGASAVVSVVEQHGQTTDPGCWTFDRRTPHLYLHGGSVPVGATIGRRPVPGTSR